MSAIYLRKLKWSGLHFLLGFLVLSVAGFYIYSQWFYAGRHYLTDLVGLAGIILSIDLILGPMLCLWLLSPIKTRKENITNLILIVFLQLSSLSYGVMQIDSQRLAYIVKWQTSYFAISKGDARGEYTLEGFYLFNEPAVGTKNRALYGKLIEQSIPPIEMNEFFQPTDFVTECKTICGVITKNGIVNVTKINGVLTFNKSLH
ncbi:fimbrial assembly protein [Pseudoalteromonas shioyasakiensis]|uniref:fimbrial assembly protein n=1 Tax=Pseudoalteromonas shioyasakiensis TaxID=1190813 RepID=UPI002119832F|nr:fimbrial assembly protein [Pseudoalteromonas shioyasakiensis]MCQ8878881.1 fimbrial assembly protein [Pseudoalteromonas shioyasakiensis]